MSDTITVGDRVQWLHRWYGQDADELVVGTVLEIVTTASGPYAWVSVAKEQSLLFARLANLTVITDDDTNLFSDEDVESLATFPPALRRIVEAVAAMPQDDADREGAISSLRDLVDDYTFAVGQAGDLSGADLGAWEYGL